MKRALKLSIIFFCFIFVYLVNKLFFNEYLTKKYYSLLTNKQVSISLWSVLKCTAILLLIIILIYLLINFILNRYELILKIKKFKFNLNENFHIFIKQLEVAIVVVTIIVALLTFKDIKNVFMKTDLNKIEKIYFNKIEEINLVGGESDNYLLENNVFSFPKPEEIITIDINTLEENIPASKDDGSLDVLTTLNVDGIKLTTYGTIKVQGSSTAYWPKKNWTIKLFKDETREEEIKIRIGDSIFSNKWIAKADWNDPAMLRNYLSYNLWGNIVNSREIKIKNEVDNSTIKNLGAQGYPHTFISNININNEHYGISLLLTGHDPANFNIDKENNKHLYFEFDGRIKCDSTDVWERFKSEGIEKWIDGYYPENEDFTETQKKAIDNLGKFLNSNLENFKKEFDIHLDKKNIIDMLLFYEVIYDLDALAYDIEVVTYDLEKFYFLPWDKDTTFGVHGDGKGLMKSTESKLLINYKKESEEQKPWFKTYHAFKDDVEARYKYLRDNNVFTVENLEKLINEVNDKVSEEIWLAEETKWAGLGRPLKEETDKSQILDWFEKRLKMLDKHFNYK